jgi:hypothetical protein
VLAQDRAERGARLGELLEHGEVRERRRGDPAGGQRLADVPEAAVLGLQAEHRLCARLERRVGRLDPHPLRRAQREQRELHVAEVGGGSG